MHYIKILDPNLNHFLQNAFITLNHLEGQIYRSQLGRKTIAFNLHQQIYFAKIHHGVGWKEIIKNLLQFRLPIISAETEWRALLALQRLNIPAPIPVAFGKKGFNPAALQSFIVTKSLPHSINLEEFFKQRERKNFLQKRNIIETVAKIANNLHANGINHRDFYLCHFLMELSTINSEKPFIYLIDLHRAQIRKKIPFRWRVKDISGLYFSTMNLNFSDRDYLRFLRIYTGKPIRVALKQDLFFWRMVILKAKRLYAAHMSK